MGRTQVYLGEEELKLLDRVSQETGASRSELIRRAVQASFGRQGKEARLSVGQGYNHFEIAETFANPYGLIGRTILEQMGLGPSFSRSREKVSREA